MFDKKFALILLFLLVGIVTVSSVGAADLNATADEMASDNDNVILQDTSEEVIANEVDNEPVNQSVTESYVLGGDEYGTFTDIQTAIDNAGSGASFTLTGEFYGFGNDMIVINKPVTLKSTTGAVLRANTNTQVKCGIFQISSSNVVLEGLTLIGGNNQWGGAVNMLQASTSNNYKIINCTFIDNVADGNYGYGGAICTFGNNGLISDCTFTNNHCSDYGGAVYINGENSQILNCVFDHNYVSGPLTNWQGGGAIYNDCAALVINNCNFTSNYASLSRGGALLVAATATVKNSIFKGNIANEGTTINCQNEYCIFTGNRFMIAKDENMDEVFFGRTVEELKKAGNIYDDGKENSTIKFNVEKLVMYYGGQGVVYATVVGGTIGKVSVLNKNPSISVSGNKITIKGLDIGTYVLKVESNPDDNHYANSNNMTITVKKATVKIAVKPLTVYFNQLKKWTVTVKDVSNNKPLANAKVLFRISVNGYWMNKYATTNANGVATLSIKLSNVGNHKVVISYSNSKYACSAVSSYIKVIKRVLYYTIGCTPFDDGSKVEVQLNDKLSNTYPGGVKVRMLIYTGSRVSKNIPLVTGKYKTKLGYVAYATNMLSAGYHTVKIISADSRYSFSGTAKLYIKPIATKQKKTYMTISNGIKRQYG